MKTIELTDREIELLMNALDELLFDIEQSSVGPLEANPPPVWPEATALADNLRELLNRDDGWGDAEQDFIQTGIDAREQLKATSRAATRRERRSKHSSHQVANDPIDW